MKTIIFLIRKRARTPKMHGLATAAGSASVIRELCRLARCDKCRVYLVDAQQPSTGDAASQPSAPARSPTSAPRQ